VFNRNPEYRLCEDLSAAGDEIGVVLKNWLRLGQRKLLNAMKN
jgi:hypothetical protein